MELGVGKAGAKRVTETPGKQAGGGAKQGPSKFDSIRADLREQLIEKAKLPPKVAEIAPQQKQLLENDLRRRLEQNKPQSAAELFKDQVSSAQTGLDSLKQAVAKIPQHDAFAPIRNRLQSIEKDFASVGKEIDKPGAMDSPGALLQMQERLYGVTENITVLSQVVSQVNSGIKTVIQTQI